MQNVSFDTPCIDTLWKLYDRLGGTSTVVYVSRTSCPYIQRESICYKLKKHWVKKIGIVFISQIVIEIESGDVIQKNKKYQMARSVIFRF